MKTVVKPSKIHGKGLFADQFIAKGDVLGICETRETLDANNPTDYTLFLDVETNYCVDVICDLRYINHSEDPNVCYSDDLVVTALKNINKGDELTHDYNGGEEEVAE